VRLRLLTKNNKKGKEIMKTKYQILNWMTLLVLSSVLVSQAETITYQESANQIKYSNGSAIAYNAGDETYDALAVKLGWFSDGFTPTASNFASWETNFNFLINDTTTEPPYSGRGALGYAINPGAATLLGASNISVQITFGRNNPGGDFASLLPPGKTIWLIGSSVSNATALSTGSIYSPTAEFFAVQKSAWTTVPTVTADGGTTDYLLASVSTSSDVKVGSYDVATGSIIMVPEPSTGALMMIGAAGLVALRRLRKV